MDLFLNNWVQGIVWYVKCLFCVYLFLDGSLYEDGEYSYTNMIKFFKNFYYYSNICYYTNIKHGQTNSFFIKFLTVLYEKTLMNQENTVKNAGVIFNFLIIII